MARIKFSLLTLLPLIITLSLFVIGFTWVKPGYLDLSGDSSRLYFYDAINYLKSQSLYSVSPSGLGGENVSFYGIPHFITLAALNLLLGSGSTLVSFWYGMSLSLAFLFTYLAIRLIIVNPDNNQESNLGSMASIIGGLYYVFSPSSITGWGHNISTYNQIFLNPMMFYLITLFLITKKKFYLFTMLFITLVFSPNFSLVGAPPFIAFYPISITFLILYLRIIRKVAIAWKDIFIGIMLFLFINAYQLIPVVINMLSPGSYISNAVFSTANKADRFRYFLGIVDHIKVSLDWMGLPQLSKLYVVHNLQIIFPLVIILGFLCNKSKTLLLTGLFFLISFYFAVANITILGFNFYKSLFNIPGFSMFRNFYGQWAYLFLFFYALLFSQSLLIVLNRVSKKLIITISFVFVSVLILTAWPLINGSIVNTYQWTSDNVKMVFRIDPDYEKVLTYFRNLKSDGKIILFPFTDHGYQVLGGIDPKTAYLGPSTISYLTGKQDFSGYVAVGKNQDLMLKLARLKDYETFDKLLGLLGIRYIFYNNDPGIYDSSFPSFPYDYVRNYFPGNQEGYTNFISELNLKQTSNIDNKYLVYKLPDNDYLKEIYATNNSSLYDQYLNDSLTPLTLPIKDIKNMIYFDAIAVPSVNQNDYIAVADDKFQSIIKNPSPPLILHNAFATTPPWSLIYPFIMLKEELSLKNYFRKMTPDNYIDKRLFASAKRIFELEKFSKEMNVLQLTTDPDELRKDLNPTGRIFLKNSVMSSWEWNLARYYNYLSESIAILNTSDMTDQWKLYQKFLINEYLLQHRLRLTKLIRGSEKIKQESQYLFDLIDNIYTNLIKQLNYQVPDIDKVAYSMNLSENNSNYKLFIESQLFQNNGIDIIANNARLNNQCSNKNNYWYDCEIVNNNLLNSGNNIIQLVNQNQVNLLESAERVYPEVIQNTKNDIQLSIDTVVAKGQTGIFWKFNNIHPNNYYFISFEYKAPNIPLELKFFTSQLNNQGIRENSPILDEGLISKNWTNYQGIIVTGDYTDSALLGLISYPYEADDAKYEIRNLAVNQISVPKIILQKTNSENTSAPEVNFEKINPVKYIAHVKNALNPYYLVLNQIFSTKWKMYLTNSKKISIFDCLFNTAKVIANHQHYPVNTDVNAWYITPNDVGNLQDYDLTIEISSQYVFYYAGIVSLITLVIVIILFIRSIWQKKYI